MKFKIRGQEFELDFLDADEMERVEKVCDRAIERNKIEVYEGLTQSQMIRTQCKIVFDFFDEVFGEGAHKRIFGNKCNLRDALEAFGAFFEAKASSAGEMEQIKNKYDPNRAQRRAEKQANRPAPVPYNPKKKGKRNH